MPENLFGPDEQDTVATVLTAYAEELLIDAPVSMVSVDNPQREANSHKLAKKDVARLYRALEKKGLTITAKQEAI